MKGSTCIIQRRQKTCMPFTQLWFRNNAQCADCILHVSSVTLGSVYDCKVEANHGEKSKKNFVHFLFCEGELINMTRAWDKEKFWVPDRKRTHDLLNTGRALYPLSYENSWRARSFNWLHIWQVSCILLGSTLSKSLWVVII